VGFSPHHAQRPCDAPGAIPLVRFGDAVRGLRDHRVDKVADPSKLVDDAFSRLRRQGGRVERGTDLVQGSAGGNQRIEHVFVL